MTGGPVLTQSRAVDRSGQSVTQNSLPHREVAVIDTQRVLDQWSGWHIH